MLEMDAEEFRRLAHRAVDVLADDLARTVGDPTAPARRPLSAALRTRVMEQPLPEEPVPPGGSSPTSSPSSCRTRWATPARASSAGSTRRRPRWA